MFRQDWGEQLVGKHEPVVVVCDTESETVFVPVGIPAHLSPGQVTWTPDGKGIVGVAWENEPRRLGLIYCTNRQSYIFHLTADGVFSMMPSYCFISHTKLLSMESGGILQIEIFTLICTEFGHLRDTATLAFMYTTPVFLPCLGTVLQIIFQKFFQYIVLIMIHKHSMIQNEALSDISSGKMKKLN